MEELSRLTESQLEEKGMSVVENPDQVVSSEEEDAAQLRALADKLGVDLPEGWDESKH